MENSESKGILQRELPQYNNRSIVEANGLFRTGTVRQGEMLRNYQFPLGALIHFHQHLHFDLFITAGVILILMVFSHVTRVM